MTGEKRKRKLPEGIRQRGKTFEGRVTFNRKTYSVHGKTITETKAKLIISIKINAVILIKFFI